MGEGKDQQFGSIICLGGEDYHHLTLGLSIVRSRPRTTAPALRVLKWLEAMIICSCIPDGFDMIPCFTFFQWLNQQQTHQISPCLCMSRRCQSGAAHSGAAWDGRWQLSSLRSERLGDSAMKPINGMVNDGQWWLMMVDDGWWWLMMVDDGWWWLMMVNDGWWWLMMVDDC